MKVVWCTNKVYSKGKQIQLAFPLGNEVRVFGGVSYFYVLFPSLGMIKISNMKYDIGFYHISEWLADGKDEKEVRTKIMRELVLKEL